MAVETLCASLSSHPHGRLRFVTPSGTVAERDFSQLHADVKLLTGQLRDAGLVAGDLVGLLGPNSYDWIVADLALVTLGCICVALPTEQARDGAATAALRERFGLSALLIDRSIPLHGDRPSEVAFLDERPLALEPRRPADRPALSLDVFTIAFSSGTTGTSKGLMLSRRGVENTLQISAQAWKIGPDDDILIVMPFSNFQQRFLLYLAIASGSSVCVVPIERMFQMMRVLEPTIVLGPPSFFELVPSAIRSAGRRSRARYRAAAALHASLPRASRPLRARLGRRWTAMYGSRARLMLVGSAPVPRGLVETFHRFGAPLYEVYGATEVGWITFNSPKRHRIGTSGLPVDGVEVALDAEGAVRVRSRAPQALGYAFDDAGTQATTFLADGSVATGDLGQFDEAGFLRLMGRRNNVIVTRSGVKINPEEIEQEIERACTAARALVMARADLNTLRCVVWLDEDGAVDRRGDVEAAIERLNALRQPSHRITEILFRPAAELTPESGLLTRNLKIDRSAVARELLPEHRLATR